MRGGNIRCSIPASTTWFPQLQTQLQDHILYISGKIQNIEEHPAQPPPITGPPEREKISVLASDAQAIVFKSFTAQSAAGYEVNQNTIRTITSNLLNRLPIALNQEWLKSQKWYQEISSTGFSLTKDDAQVLIDSGNAYPLKYGDNNSQP